jgi:hypothetical protein
MLARKPAYRVVVLADPPALARDQAQALEHYLDQGGSVLMSAGPRCAKAVDSLNETLYRDGLGWLPARLDRVEGDEKKLDQAARIRSTGLTHPALAYFADPKRGLDQGRFPRWLKTTPGKDARAIAMLNVEDPLLIEKAVGPGRVLLSAVPLDRSWGADFPSQQAYPLLVHHLLLYLAETGNNSWRLLPGQRPRWQPPSAEAPPLPTTAFWHTVQRGRDDDKKKKRPGVAVAIASWPWLGPEVRRPGAYRLSQGADQAAWFVLAFDPRESDLSAASAEEERGVARLLSLGTVDQAALPDVSEQSSTPFELWWALFLLVIGFLCLEIWLTRRMALARQGGSAG